MISTQQQPTTNTKVTVEFDLSDKFCADVMCTALEGGIGYWCCAYEIQRKFYSEDNNDRYVSFHAFDTDMKTDDELESAADLPGKVDGAAFDPVEVTYDTIRQGIRRILSGEVKIAPSIVAYIVRDIASEGGKESSGDIDADAADCIVQAGALGDLVFG